MSASDHSSDVATPAGAADPQSSVHAKALRALRASGIEHLVGGAYELEWHIGAHLRDTKDLDVFVRPRDFSRTLDALAAAGFETEVFAHWLGKARRGSHFVDVIFRSGNGEAVVDDAWFERAVPAEVLGVAVRFGALENGIMTRAFVMERERFDGADVAHLLRCRAEQIDWDRLLALFGRHWRVLAAHLVLFGYIYPAERQRIPARVMRDLVGRMSRESHEPPPPDRVCQGTLLSRAQYLVDVEQWRYEDARRSPRGALTPGEIDRWTRAIDEEE
ncbi:MAG TPA: nucleotidyltransferase family protein [Candidatus Binatia bacterium]|nr:nucleotidyltransferase family protein [Candidatus Binatia bacterium]